MDKQESGDNSSQAHVTSRCLSPLLPESDPEHRPDTNAQPQLQRAQMLSAEQASSIFNRTDDVRARCHGSFPDSPDWGGATGCAEQMYAEQGVPHLTQGSDPPPQL